MTVLEIEDLMAEFGIDSDYLNFGAGGGRYFAVLSAVIDGERNAAALTGSKAEACEWLAGGFDNDNPREPLVVVDRQTGRRYRPLTTVSVTLEETARALPALSYFTQLGREAHGRGEQSAPALDPKVQERLVGLQVGETGAAIMQAWLDGWHEANRAS